MQAVTTTKKPDRRLTVAALISGEPTAADLWTLRKLAGVARELVVLQAGHGRGTPRWKRIRQLLREYGVARTCSRLLGGIVGASVAKSNQPILDELFDVEELRQWWKSAGIRVVLVATLNHEECRRALTEIGPDLLVRVSGGILKPHIFSSAKMAALNIHHGQAPAIRGMWSIPWGIVEGKGNWIGATVHVIDNGIDTGAVLWRGGPQLAPGDTTVDLFFRTHLLAADALADVIEVYSKGECPASLVTSANEPSTYRSAPGVWAWLKLLYLGQGSRAPVLLEKARRC